MKKLLIVQNYVRKLSKRSALGLVLVIYLIGLGIAWIITQTLKNLTIHPLLIVFIADIGVTFFMFLVSQILKNASAYDPYWSVAPIFIITYFWTLNPDYPSISLRQIIVFILVLLWGIRLTGNWIGTWRGWTHEDWRYAKFRQEHPRIFWLINFTGIQLVPTIVVFLGCLALWPIFALPESGTTGFAKGFNWVDVFGVIFTLGAIMLELFADIQIHRFTAIPTNQGKTIRTGLWSISRHPNYLGEQSFWWGLFCFGYAANTSFWWMILGPIIMDALFFGISIPLMEKRNLERRKNYREYQQSVSILIPIPKGKLFKRRKD